jgi:hypothetical protein
LKNKVSETCGIHIGNVKYVQHYVREITRERTNSNILTKVKDNTKMDHNELGHETVSIVQNSRGLDLLTGLRDQDY